jgi:hypothetical protein
MPIIFYLLIRQIHGVMNLPNQTKTVLAKKTGLL